MSEALERVIAEQQAKIDRLEKLLESRNSQIQGEFKRLSDLFSKVSLYISVADRIVRSAPKADNDESTMRMYRNAKESLKAQSEVCGFCWRCESYGCVCSDCECED
jgi:SMC interacting uncharacterized protein involved in chromosome segregation